VNFFNEIAVNLRYRKYDWDLAKLTAVGNDGAIYLVETAVPLSPFLSPRSGSPPIKQLFLEVFSSKSFSGIWIKAPIANDFDAAL